LTKTPSDSSAERSNGSLDVGDLETELLRGFFCTELDGFGHTRDPRSIVVIRYHYEVVAVSFANHRSFVISHVESGTGRCGSHQEIPPSGRSWFVGVTVCCSQRLPGTPLEEETAPVDRRWPRRARAGGGQERRFSEATATSSRDRRQ